MNAKNKDLFFNENDDETVIVTIAPETSEEFDVEIIASMEIEELSREYVAVLPINPTEELPEDELILFRYSEDEEGNPEFEGITDDDELQSVASAFEQYFDQAANELYNDQDYLKDIGSYVPGIKIK
ncbi:MAG: DUF1292 domain-containing protein [Lachnospiraceae bacterium]|nr:DUF1292 domain-containing protein [Lachnospiraceae bacterium]